MSMLLFILTFVCRRVNSLPSTPPYQALQQHNIDAYICPSYIYGTHQALQHPNIDAYICPSYIYGTHQALQQHNIDAYICPSYIYGTYVMLEVLLMYYYVLFSVYISGNYLIADI